MTIFALADVVPEIAASAFVAPTASVIGKVTLGEHASVWFGATLRGDNERITVGAHSNVQEGAVLHTDMGFPLLVGNNVTVGHQAMLHGCTVEDGVLIGIQAVVLNGALIGRESLVGAGALVTEGKRFPSRSLILGAPARVARVLTDEELQRLARSAAHYAQRQAYFRQHLRALPDTPEGS